MKDLKEDLIHEVDCLLNNITTARRLRNYSMEVEAKEMFYRWIMKRKILEERKKTLEEVSKAFHETFYRSGELWFDYLFEDGDKEAEENARGVVDEYWEEILSKITKRGK